MYCYLCGDYMGLTTMGHFCEKCKKIRHIISVYGANEVKTILEDICLRDAEKRNNKINQAVTTNCYSPACKKPTTRSDTEKKKE